MKVIIEEKAKSCPGVVRALDMTQDYLRRGNILISAGQLIHNRREMERLQSLGLKIIDYEQLDNLQKPEDEEGEVAFLVRAHGEADEILEKAKDCGLTILDGTCPIVTHSHDIVTQHAIEGYGIIIVGKKNHPEVKGLVAKSRGNAIVITDIDEIEKNEYENRSLLLAQSTVNPDLFKQVREALSEKIPNLKIADTICRYLKKRREHIKEFAVEYDVCIVVGGKNSSNSRLLFETARALNPKTYYIEDPEELEAKWFKKAQTVGISGGASTPNWQLEELKQILEANHIDKNPKGLKNTKGGTTKWWKWKPHKNN